MLSMSRLTLVALLSLYGTTALGCPCGCGAVNAQVMNPGESWRFATSVAMDTGFETIDFRGHASDDVGPEVKNTFTLGVARAFSRDFSGTLTLQSHRNSHSEEVDNYSIGDPSVSLRWTAYSQSFVRPYIPQLQVFGTYKHPVAKSTYDQDYGMRQMEIHGNGLAELVGGVDVWWGMDSLKYGVTQSLIKPLKRRFTLDSGDLEVDPGLGYKTSLSGAYNMMAVGTVLVSIDREAREPLHINGVKRDDSEILVHSGSVMGSLKVGFMRTVGLTYKRTAAFAENRNTTRAHSVTVSYMEAL